MNVSSGRAVGGGVSGGCPVIKAGGRRLIATPGKLHTGCVGFNLAKRVSPDFSIVPKLPKPEVSIAPGLTSQKDKFGQGPPRHREVAGLTAEP